jgi:uncharacterized protein YaeQ
MALSATVYHLQVDLSDVDRGVYQALDLRVARHPSETMRYLLTRVIAYCLCYEEGIAFTKGLSDAEDPALWIKDLQGNLRAWIEIGTPSAERLHKASKGSPRVVARRFTKRNPSKSLPCRASSWIPWTPPRIATRSGRWSTAKAFFT